ncbi:uncharacterized protein LOC141537109 [Cotesia typhae]|uniref:uncharacterized protein LOC141537109 n=1 Tax=Cotesia typhae TaxID=2053667 RepID=UPI003D69FB34
MFFVVFYDTWCSTVPESWLNKKCQTLKWPPKSENPTTAAIKQNNPKKSWATIQYSRLLGPFQTYDIARSVEIAAVDLSTSDETAFSKLQDGKLLDRKRNRKPPVRYRKENSSDIPSSDDDGSEFQPDVTDTISRDVFAYDTTQNLDDGNLIETQELDYGNFFNDHPDHSSKRETKK